MLLFDMLLGEVPLYRALQVIYLDFKRSFYCANVFVWFIDKLVIIIIITGLFFIMNDVNIIADLQWLQGPKHSPILIEKKRKPV